MALALILALLVAAFGSQTFYPREGAVGMWAAIGLMLRLMVEKQKAEVKQIQLHMQSLQKLITVPAIKGAAR
jgi:hypothetical protein